MKNSYRQALLEEMEILHQLLEESTDPVQAEAIIKMLAQLTKYVDTNKLA